MDLDLWMKPEDGAFSVFVDGRRVGVGLTAELGLAMMRAIVEGWLASHNLHRPDRRAGMGAEPLRTEVARGAATMQ